MNRKGLFAIGEAVYGMGDRTGLRGQVRSVFSNLRGRTPTVEDLAGLSWYNLPGTGKELDTIANFFPEHKFLRGSEASEANLKAANKSSELSNYKYILFATHGIFVPEAPELSSIVLSQNATSRENDGYITVGEWMTYTLNSDLVYLSACETGLGRYQSGEGIVGIPYALCVAGNCDTVMSLWKADDESAAVFSASFFEKLVAGKSAVEAINETKRELMTSSNPKHREPSIWSAFVLYGI